MAAVIAILIGVFAFTRPKSNGPTIAVKTPPKSTGAALPGFPLKNEVNALANRDEKAGAALEAVVANTGPGEQRAWAQLLAGVAHLAAGRSEEARVAFRKSEVMADSVKEPGLSKYLKTVSARLSQTGEIPPAETQNFSRDNYEALSYLLYGLHNWQLGSIEEGVAAMRQFRSCTINGSGAWIAELKPLATHFVERYVSFQMAVDVLKSAGDSADRTEAAKALRKLEPTLVKATDAAIAPYATQISEYEKEAVKIPEPAVYRIINKHSKRVIDVDGRKRDRGAKVHQWEYLGSLNQHWELVPVSGNTFKIRAAHSGLLLNLRDSSTMPGAIVWQWDDDGTSAGLWKIEPKGDGCYFIRSVSSNQVLAVDNMSMDNGGAITQWDKPGTDDHFWRFERVAARIKDWCTADFGVVNAAGSTKVEGSAISIACNNDDVWFKKDSFRYAYQEIHGDFDMVAQLKQMSEGDPWAKAGIMVRNSILPTSRNLFFGVSGEHGVFIQGRNGDDNDTEEKHRSPREELKGPGWIKVTRRGNTFTLSHSRDGNTWTEVAKEKGDFIREAVVGLAVCSHNGGKVFNVEFDNVSLKKL